jgi:hypothetical protein
MPLETDRILLKFLNLVYHLAFKKRTVIWKLHLFFFFSREIIVSSCVWKRRLSFGTKWDENPALRFRRLISGAIVPESHEWDAGWASAGLNILEKSLVLVIPVLSLFREKEKPHFTAVI